MDLGLHRTGTVLEFPIRILCRVLSWETNRVVARHFAADLILVEIYHKTGTDLRFQIRIIESCYKTFAVDLILFQLGQKSTWYCFNSGRRTYHAFPPSVESYFLHFSKSSYAPIESRSHSPIQQNKPISLTRQNSPFDKKGNQIFPFPSQHANVKNNSKLGKSG